MKYARVIGTGSYLPDKILTNHDLERIVDTSDEWIRTRTGIAQRHIAADSEMASDLALNASREAIKAGGIDPREIELVIVATTTPGHDRHYRTLGRSCFIDAALTVDKELGRRVEDAVRAGKA